MNRNGWVDYGKSGSPGNSLIELSEKADKCLENNNLSESIIICKVLIANVSKFLNSVDDSSGLLSTAISNSFSTLSEAMTQCHPMLKDQLFDFCITEYQNKKYSNIGIEDEFLTLLPELVTTDEQEKIFFDILDICLSIEITNEASDYRCVRIISAKADYFLSNDMKEEADKLIIDNMNYPEFRGIIVDQYIAKKDFTSAQKLCLEGIKISESKKHYGTMHDWMDKLLQISELEKNIDNIRKWSEKLFFEHGFDMKYYRILKQTYLGKDNEWKNECEKIPEILGQDIDGWNSESLYERAEIFIEENYSDRLLKLIQNNRDDILFVDKFAEKIKDKYPAELIELYSTAIIKHAKTADKRVYKEAVKYLKH